jgi:hypothetical protein
MGFLGYLLLSNHQLRGLNNPWKRALGPFTTSFSRVLLGPQRRSGFLGRSPGRYLPRYWGQSSFPCSSQSAATGSGLNRRVRVADAMIEAVRGDAGRI